MKIKMRAILLFGVGCLLATSPLEARKSEFDAGPGKSSGIDQIAANCVPATAFSELNINNTRARIMTGGDMWWDLQQSSQYEIPKGSGRTSLFAGALWLGGVDVSNQLKVAGQRFRSQGNDYWTGPLSTETAEVDPSTCIEFDRHFSTTKSQIVEFVSWNRAKAYDEETGENTVEDLFPNGYSVPDIIQNWPAHGRNYAPFYEDFYLAPFIDVDGDGLYDWTAGDYPGYDLDGNLDCSKKIANIYGDQNLWWVFNDKGNIHTETGSNAIGMEIRAQAFAFATSDEVNNMTFYNYELINRSTFTLTQTYFGQWVDADLGNPQDDYVGCDVGRGLGYCYNGDNIDEDNQGAKGYGEQPPAIGVDFFQGPFQDPDLLDNAVGIGPDEAMNGVGYGDGIPDNERYGMRRFLYHNNDATVTGDPENGPQYYNYLKGIWKDNSKMVYGGTGHIAGCAAPYTCEPADFMFPDDTDTAFWGTNGNPQIPWTETATPFDRRFIQSTGPFTLAPGAVNNITVGVVWARANSGGPFASVQELRRADDRTQAMFDNCFRILEGPNAPDLTFQELDQEIIIYITNPRTSNNYLEAYENTDPQIIPPTSIVIGTDQVIAFDTTFAIADTLVDTLVVPYDTTYVFDTIIDPSSGYIVTTPIVQQLSNEEIADYNKYKFQGYKIYQLKDKSISSNDLEDNTLARLVFQCDLKDGVSKIINFEYSEDLQASVPKLMVEGSDKGIQNTFSVKEDVFASGNKALVNHKTYYFLAVAYAYNYSPYNEYNPNDPDKLEGQKKPYIQSRVSGNGGEIRAIGAIPHKTEVESGGTVARSSYGDGVEITKYEGRGNGGNVLRLTKASQDAIVNAGVNGVSSVTYQAGFGPIEVKVIDPLNVPAGDFMFYLLEEDTADFEYTGAKWRLEYDNGSETVVYNSDNSIELGSEQLLLDIGLSIKMRQVDPIDDCIEDDAGYYKDDFLEAWIEFEDPDNRYLSGIPDEDGFSEVNWIRSGVQGDDSLTFIDANKRFGSSANPYYEFTDCNSYYENILEGTIAPFALCALGPDGPIPHGGSALIDYLRLQNYIRHIHSVDIVFTPDKSKWTRVPVLEMQTENKLAQGGLVGFPLSSNNPHGYPVYNQGPHGFLRFAPSLDKNGTPYDTTGLNGDLRSIPSSTNPNAPNFIGGYGMSWFPGYAIDVETGERLNMAFGEDSRMRVDNGDDMIWNPTSNIYSGPFNTPRLGGKHFIYVFRNNVVHDRNIDASFFVNNPNFQNAVNRMPAYDYGEFAFNTLNSNNIMQKLHPVYGAASWVVNAISLPENEWKSMKDGLVPSEVQIGVRVSKSYRGYVPSTAQSHDVEDAGGASIPVPSGTKEWFVDKGPITYGGTVYQHGDYFLRDATTDDYILDAGTANTRDLKKNIFATQNGGRPMYSFNTDNIATLFNNNDILVESLDKINVVPNPYYAYSEYEQNKLDYRIKIINLPQQANIKIYTTGGVLVRTFTKDDNTITSIDWDLNNQSGIKISSGIYLIHVEIPGVGEKILKWYGMLRPIDLDSF